MDPRRSPTPSEQARATTTLPREPASASAARSWLGRALESWGREDPEGLSALLTTEVVTNAIRHATSAVVVDLSVDDDVLTVEVRDKNPASPEVQHPAPDDAGGRGMWLVDALALRWGADCAGEGKSVWFQVRVQRRP